MLCIGLAGLLHGVWMLSEPAGWIVGGLVLVVAAALVEVGR